MPLSPTYCVLRGQKGLGGLGTSCSSGLFLFSGLRRHRQGGKMVDVLANLKVGFIGGGNMARAIAEGFISSGVISPIQITVSATTDKTLASWKDMGCHTTLKNSEVALACNVLFLAVKPHQIAGILLEVRQSLTEQQLIVSVAAGITVEAIEKTLPPDSKHHVIRCLPNLACSVESGVVGYCCGTNTTRQDAALFQQLMDSIALTLEMKEAYINSAGAFGSAIAFTAMAVEALSDGGVKSGMPRSLSSKIAAQTVLGAAKYIQGTGKHPGQVKDEVASPGGTTIAGILALEKNGFRAALIEAMDVAKKRADEMGS